MMIKKDYTQYKCYTWMKKEHKESFDRLATHYGAKLNKGCPVGDTLYTSHDFDKHCNDIFKIISNIILLHADEKMFNSKELYILHLSVLFHDISMAMNITFNRDKHSQESADYVRNEEKNESSPLYQEKQNNNLTHNDISVIRKIITAHSDIKDGSVDDDKNGIKNPDLTFKMNGSINGKALAAILRLADELDITSDRLGTETFANQLSNDIENQRISIRHWKKLHYFSMIDYTKNDLSQLEIHCDDEYILTNIDDISNIVSDIMEIRNKILKELTTALNYVFNTPENSKIGFRCDKIKIVSGNDTINNEIKSLSDPISFFNYLRDPAPVDNPEQQSSDEPNALDATVCNYPEVLHEPTSRILKEYIETKNLLDGGHYKINNKYCSRDWIDTNEIIETGKICDLCIEKFAEHCIKKRFHEDSIIIGLDLEGSILASLLAMKLNLPFQYVIPAKSEEKNSTNDIEENLPTNKNIIIVTDAVCTYDTICTTLDKYKLHERVVAIYTLLYRESKLKSSIKVKLKEKTFCINKDFPMELIKRGDCNYKKCIAKNKKIEV